MSSEPGSPPAPPSAPPPAPEGRRVDWIELFFDLAMVAFITELALGLHGAPTPTDFATFIAWSIPAWWAWTNVMVCVNVLPPLPARPAGIALLGAMGAIGLMAASVTVTAERAWAFALANGVLRLILLVLWLYRATRSGASLPRTVVYNGATALIWIVSAFLPTPLDFVLWGVAILIEVLLLRVGTRRFSESIRVDVAHASERLGLFMIILMGESVLSVVTSLSAHWSVASGVAALLGFVAIAVIAWGFFVAGAGTIERGLDRLNERRNIAGLLDTVMFLPYLIVVSVTMFAAGLATAVARAGEPLALGSAVSLCAGLALFYFTNAIVVVRYGTPWRQVLPWAIPGVVLPSVLLTVSSEVSATATLGFVTAIVVVIVIVSAIAARAAARAEARSERR